jgi:PAS domain S-box-containing protein
MSFLTERKSATAVLTAANENALRESEERFRELADNISQFAWTADAKGWRYWYNKRWYDYTGTTLEDMQGWGWQKVHHPEHVNRVVQRLRQSFETGTPWEDTFPLRSKDGNYRWFLSRALPIRNEAGEVIRWFGTNTDVTQQIEAENALREGEQELRNARDAAEAALQNLRETQASLIEAEKFAALGRLVSGVAHEINSPVGICLTVASTLERKSALFGAEVVRGDVKRSSLNDFLETSRDGSAQLVANLNRVAELIQSFKQIADDRISSDKRTFDLGDLTGQVLMSMRPSLRKHNLTLDVDCQPNLLINSYPGPCGQLLTPLPQFGRARFSGRQGRYCRHQGAGIWGGQRRNSVFRRWLRHERRRQASGLRSILHDAPPSRQYRPWPPYPPQHRDEPFGRSAQS